MTQVIITITSNQQHLIIYIKKIYKMQLQSYSCSLKKNQSQQSDKKEKKNNKKITLRKKRIIETFSFSKVDLKHILNINDTWFINEETLKNSQSSQQNIQRAMFRYKMISKIILNNSFVGLQLKKVDDNYLPPQYFFQRFRSLGDKNIATIANHLQCIYQSFNQIQMNTQSPDNQQHDNQLKLLNQYLDQMQGRMYTIYYVEIKKKCINLKNIFFSVLLLQTLGWNIKRVANDFLKYRHVFFEIFSPKHYKNYIELTLNNYMKAQQLLKNPTLSKQQIIQLTTIYFDDQVVRQVETPNGIYEEFLQAKVKFSCPHPTFCCVEILKIIENTGERILKKKKPKSSEIIQISSIEQLQQLKKLGFQNEYLTLQNQTNNNEKQVKQA